jgi:hypothetical protein
MVDFAPGDTGDQNNMPSSRLLLDRLLARHQSWPNAEPRNRSDDVLQARLHQITRYNHALVQLADSMTWDGIAKKVADLSPPASEGMGPSRYWFA